MMRAALHQRAKNMGSIATLRFLRSSKVFRLCNRKHDKVFGFFQINSQFSDSFTTIRIFTDHFSGRFHNCPNFSGLQDHFPFSGQFQTVQIFPDHFPSSGRCQMIPIFIGPRSDHSLPMSVTN